MSIGKREWWIAVMLFLLTTINCVDRLVLASVAPILQSSLHLSNTQYSYIVFSFMAGMTAGQLPIGVLIDGIGVRPGLPLILFGWSTINIFHVAAWQVWLFSGLRFIMGIFESGNYSGGLKAISQTMSVEKRAVGLGLFNSGFLLGSVLAPPIVVFTAVHFGWKAAFVIPGVVGMFWMIPWLTVYPRTLAATSAPDAQEAQPTLRSLLGLRQTWGVIAVRASSGPLSQFYWYWLPLYLVRGRGASMAQMGKLASLAYIVGACGNVAGSSFSGWLIRRRMKVDRSRKLTFVLGAVMCASSTAIVPFTASLVAADLLVGIAIFGLNVMSCMLLAVMSDIFPAAGLARVGGLTGVGEGIVNMILTLCTGIILDRFSFFYVFVSASLLPVISTWALLGLVRAPEQREAARLAAR